MLGVTAIALVPGSSSKIGALQPGVADLVAIQSQATQTAQPQPIAVNTTYTVCGTASYYDLPGITANGETFNPKALTAAHPWIPFDSWVRIVDRHTGMSVKVRINDRGPWVEDHMLDLTPAAMAAIDPDETLDIRHVCLHW